MLKFNAFHVFSGLGTQKKRKKEDENEKKSTNKRLLKKLLGNRQAFARERNPQSVRISAIYPRKLIAKRHTALETQKQTLAEKGGIYGGQQQKKCQFLQQAMMI